ncbi:maf protein [Sulfobacillus acidophilus TPY]|uniref:dTTP/UTP pyrophosphatase n=1 Tax=Sulfobacillus acidophilus (strain ATCC 700253 / DSM 10332 / NAL) TaxID=679936 RepID=G8U0F0_SULAD|nr:maf protein [Sulfobacillus acidophilus TPY]AEW06492.1 Septum formation protein Maf [Sulfobacillus acidophilus DSM 10332]
MDDVILASSSPRRRQLLSQLLPAFRVIPADIDESPRRGERPDALVRRLAVTKAITVGQLHPEARVIGADTVVAFGRVILGKPHDPEHAKAMLTMLSGQRHQVYTAVAVWVDHRGRGYVKVAAAQVTFRPLSALEIEEYVQTGEPLDKAGAYAIQGKAGQWVEAYEGNLETIIGLPLDVVEHLLNHLPPSNEGP